MAEAFARVLGEGKVEAFSAGTDPRGLHPVAVDVMRERGIDISGQRSKALSDELAGSMDYVVTVCGNAEEKCPVLPPQVRRLHWPLPDPAQAQGGREAIHHVFRTSRDEVERLVRNLLGEILGRDNA
jgi:arsenate reductase